MTTDGFSHARSFLRYARPARWTAVCCGIATALLYALLVLLLALFADLLVTRGRIPNFAQLPVREQDAVLRDWSGLDSAERARALQHLGFAEFETPPVRFDLLPPETLAKWRLYQALMGAEGVEAAPVPGRATPEQLRDWAAKRQYIGDIYYHAALENELRWRALVWSDLDRRLSPDAAERWQPAGSRSMLVLP